MSSERVEAPAKATSQNQMFLSWLHIEQRVKYATFQHCSFDHLGDAFGPLSLSRMQSQDGKTEYMRHNNMRSSC